MIVQAIDDLGGWAWIILGLVLFGLELAVPGAFFLWLGAAAVLTGLIDAALGLPWQGALVTFAALSVGSVLLGRALTRRGHRDPATSSPLNRRAEALVGRVFVLDQPITGGEGRVRIDDTSWRVVGPDAPRGASVRIVEVDGATLVAQPA